MRRLRQAHPDIDEESPRRKSELALRFLFDNALIGMREQSNFHDPKHCFLGQALFHQSHDSLPVISTIIYCYVVRQLGLDALPCGFVLRVHAIIYPPSGSDLDGSQLSPESFERPSMRVDVFNNRLDPPTSWLEEQLEERLDTTTQNVTTEVRETFLLPSSVAEITTRCRRNIITALDRLPSSMNRRLPSSMTSRLPPIEYAALWVDCLLSKRGVPRVYERLAKIFTKHFPFDLDLVERYLLPLSRGGGFERVCNDIRSRDRDQLRANFKPRTTDESVQRVLFKVGQVFKHRERRYTGVVVGWDAHFDRHNPSRMRSNESGYLRGPYYHVL